MATVRDILDDKGRHLNTISPHANVFDAATLMNEHKIGSLLVIQDGRLIGILTERDIMQRIVTEQRDARHTSVGEVMTRDVICCRMHTDVEEVRAVMRDRRIRHLPVMTDEGDVVGLISIGDLNAYQVQNQERTIYQLQEYIYGTW
jgi:CBS domain-containing protein